MRPTPCLSQPPAPHTCPAPRQFPASFRTYTAGKEPQSNIERLRRLGELLPAGQFFVFEFRDASWLCEEVYAVLRERGWALAVAHCTGARWACGKRGGGCVDLCSVGPWMPARCAAPPKTPALPDPAEDGPGNEKLSKKEGGWIGSLVGPERGTWVCQHTSACSACSHELLPLLQGLALTHAPISRSQTPGPNPPPEALPLTSPSIAYVRFHGSAGQVR